MASLRTEFDALRGGAILTVTFIVLRSRSWEVSVRVRPPGTWTVMTRQMRLILIHYRVEQITLLIGLGMEMLAWNSYMNLCTLAVNAISTKTTDT